MAPTNCIVIPTTIIDKKLIEDSFENTDKQG
jgi:hypothetical protein